MPVLEIPLDDSKAQEFFAAFGEFQKQLVKNPELWNKVSQAQRKVFATGASSPLSNVEKSWRSIAGFSGSILSNTVKITGQLLKWGTLLGGGLLGGSLWGLTRMAGDAASYRRSAMGLGMSIGGMRSFDINMQRFVDPGAFLSSINQAVSNPALQGPLYAMGVNPNGSTEQVSLAMLKAMRRLALNTPRGMLGTMSDAYGLGPFGGLETLMRLQSTPAGEFYRQLRAESSDRSTLGLPSGVASKWQAFTTQMERARAEIFKTFVVGLAPLASPLAKLSQAFSGFLSRLLSGPILKEGINHLADFLNHFSTQMASKKFQAAVDSFVSDTGTIAKGIHILAEEIRVYMGWRHPVKEAVAGARGAWAWATMGMGGGLPMLAGHGGGRYISGAAQYAGDANKLDRIFGFPAGTMRRLIGTESSWNPNAVSSKGAMGLTQLMPDTAWSYGLYGAMAMDPRQNMTVGAEYLASLVKRYHGNLQDALAAYNLGPGKFDSQYGSSVARVPRTVKSYVSAISPDSGIVVTARHKTGANPVLAAQGLSGVPQ